MSLYEGIAFIHEKQAVVLDIGAAYTKFGFTGEASPRCIIPSVHQCPKTREVKSLFQFSSIHELYNTLVEFIHLLYFRHVLVSPKDRKVIIVESLLSPTVFRDTLAKVLFCHFEVSSVLFAPAPVVSLCTLGVPTCLVVDIGYEEAVVIPVVYGVPVLRAWGAQPLGGRQLHNRLRELLDEDNGRELKLSDKIVEDIKVKTCFVTTMERSYQYTSDSPPTPPPSVTYPIQGQYHITVSGRTRELAAEVMFPRDNDNLALGNIVLDSILSCSIDTRVPLAESILLTGGTSMIPGIKSRLSSELKFLIGQPLYKDRCFIKEFKFHSAPAKENYIAWLGGAIFGGTDLINTRSLSKDSYVKDPRVPDWSNLIDNVIATN